MTRRDMRPSGWFGAAALWLAICASPTPIWAQTPRCDALDPEQQQTKRSLFAALHPYDGCDETFERCLAKKPPHPVVLRLASDVCRHIKAGRSRDEIDRLLARRAQSLLPAGKPATFALDDATLAGDPQAPVRVVVYACARCPFCKVVVPALYREVTEGALEGKAHLYFRPFPLRDHPGSIEGGLAMLSAARLGKFWPFLNRLYERYDAFCPSLLPEWAAEVGMDRAAFEEKVADPKTREALVTSKQEGIRNRVDATPALFVNGRRYVYELQPEVVVDVLLEAYDSAQASRRKP
jgi:protein-disulfide isomerase